VTAPDCLTPGDLDALAALQAVIRQQVAEVRERIASWEPAPVDPHWPSMALTRRAA